MMRSLPLALALALALGLGGCTLTSGEALFEPADGEAPRVEGSIPEAGWISVPIDLEPRAWFSEPIDPASVGPDTAALWSGDHDVEVRYHVDVDSDGRGILRLAPARPLVPGVRYVFGVSRGVTDRFGNPLQDFWFAPFETAR